METRSGSVLNPHQQRHLRVSFQEADRLLSEIERVLNSTASKSPFPTYIVDLTPSQRKTIEDYISRIRARLVRVLDGQNIEVEPPSIPAMRAIHSALTFIEIAVEELGPRYMQGYGEVSPIAAAELSGIVGELGALVQQLDRYVIQSGQDLQQRLVQLERAGTDVEVLKQLERIISEHGLVEFRATLGIVLSRLEDTSFEIAVFGRVSSGKSSLLNTVLGTDVLPVGATPITAVPTRILHSETPSLSIWLPDRAPEQYEISRLSEFASERQNPGNHKHVSRILVRLPSPWLKDGVAFVDTPGLGSLATSGAVETMAYLPRCDLGVVLIDAGATLSVNDLQTMDALYQAGIPAQVLLSKADLLTNQGLEQVLNYTAEHISSEIGTALPVHPVSLMGSHRELLTRWFEHDIVPLFEHHQELRAASLRRKIGALNQALESALRSRLRRSGRDSSATTPNVTDIRQVEADLRKAAAWIEEADAADKGFADSVSRNLESIYRRAAGRLLALWAEGKHDIDVAEETRQAALQQVQERLKVLQQALQSLASELETELGSTAQILGMPNRPSKDEFVELLREMPVLDLGTLQVSATRPLLSGLFGNRFRVEQLAQRLERQIGSQVANALTVYSRLLREWCSGVLSHMQRLFVAYADAYRAQAERAATSSSDVPPEERRAIQRDLELLAALTAVESEPARKAS
jgi:GTP-binding protein EngB required for normal cell division